MGLSMYLYRETYLGKCAPPRAVGPGSKSVISVDGGEYIDPERVKFVIEEVCYWRKANAIHRWFVTNVQGGNDDCQRYCVPREKLVELLGVVREVLAHKELAAELLPTTSGFFFGSTAYDDYYFSDLEHTKEALEKALVVDDVAFYYEASW
jgi:hypothetical protein